MGSRNVASVCLSSLTCINGQLVTYCWALSSAEGSFSCREAGREKKKWGDFLCSHCLPHAYYFLIIAIFIEDIPGGSFCTGESTALRGNLGVD